MTTETKNKNKIIIPIVATGVLLIGGVTSCTVIQNNQTDSSKETELVDNNENNNVNNNDDNINSTNDNNTNNNDDNNSNNNDNDVDLNRDEDGNISFTKKDENNEDDDYSHLKETVREKAESDDDIYFTFDEEGNLVASNKEDKEKDDNLLASAGDNSNLGSKDESNDKDNSDKESDNDSSSDSSDESPSTDDGDGNSNGSESNGSGDNNDSDNNDNNGGTGGSGSEVTPDPEPEPNPDPEPELSYDELWGAISNGNSLLDEKHRYKGISWNHFVSSLNNANKVLNNATSQSSIDSATNRLVSSINGLEVKDPTITVTGLEELEGKNNDITLDRIFKLNVISTDVDGKKLRSSVKVNGFPVLSFTDTYNLVLLNGDNKVTITTKDSYGNNVEKSFTINHVTDLTPEIEHSSISNESVKDGKFTLDVEAFDYKDDNLDVTATHNGEEVEIKNGKLVVDLVEGENKFTLSSTDKKNDATKEIEFEFEYTDEGVIIGDDVEADEPFLDVIGLDEDSIEDRKLTFTVNGYDGYGRDVSATVKHNGEEIEGVDGVYTVDLIEGDNEFEIEMTDEVTGTTITENQTVVYEVDADEDFENPKVAPELVIDGLDADYITVEDEEFTFEAIAIDGNNNLATVEVFLNSFQSIKDNDGEFTLNLQKGENNVYITATDEFGNNVGKEFTINYSGEWDDEYDGYEEKLVSGEIANTGKEFNSIRQAEDWAETVIWDWYEDGYDGYRTRQLIYQKVDDEGNAIPGTERNTWTVEFFNADEENNDSSDDNDDKDNDDNNNSNDEQEETENKDDGSEESDTDKEVEETETLVQEDDEVNADEETDSNDEPVEADEEYEEVLAENSIGNSNKEFDSFEDALAWAEQQSNDDSSEWNDYEFDLVKLTYHEEDNDGNIVEGSERTTWSIDFTEKKERQNEEIEDIDEEDEKDKLND